MEAVHSPTYEVSRYYVAYLGAVSATKDSNKSIFTHLRVHSLAVAS